MDKIILNGLIDWVYVNVNGDGSNNTIGIVKEIKIKTFDGEMVIDRKEKSIFEILNNQYFSNRFTCVSFVTSDSEITDPAKLVEGFLRKIMGDIEFQYYHHYSSYTGYLYTNEEFNVGGHDIKKLLECNCGKYIHMEIDLYNTNEIPDEIKRNI